MNQSEQIKVPYLDLKTQYHSIKSEIDIAVLNVLESSQFALGSEVVAFEEEFAGYCGAKYGVGVNSGTSALHLALLAAGIGSGDEVITTPFTFIATVSAIAYTGAKPVFVDIVPDSFCMNPEMIEQKITKATKAIIPVHIYGQSADMDAIMNIARRHHLLVIEDAAQAHGAEYKGKRVGGIGDMGCFSFYPGKNLGAYGEGGMVTTNNLDYARKIKILRDWGAEKRYHHTLKGYNYRMENIQGAVLRVKLRHLDKWTDARRSVAAEYGRQLAGCPDLIPREMPYAKHVYHVYGVRVKNRDKVQADLLANGIQTGIHYPIPVHLQECFADIGCKKGSFPVSERMADEELSLPLFPEMTDKQIKLVADSLKAVAG